MHVTDSSSGASVSVATEQNPAEGQTVMSVNATVKVMRVTDGVRVNIRGLGASHRVAGQRPSSAQELTSGARSARHCWGSAA